MKPVTTSTTPLKTDAKTKAQPLAPTAPAWYEWLVIPAAFCLSNVFEWWIHKYVMHRPVKGLMGIYKRHTLAHHEFFTDSEPIGPYRMTLAGRRTCHYRFNELQEPEKVPLDTDYASVIESDVPIVVQHTRLDSRASEIALLSTIAWPAD